MISKDVFNGYVERRDKVKTLIDENFHDIFSDKTKIQADYALSTGDYIEYTDRMIEFYEERFKGFKAVAFDMFVHIKSLQNILDASEEMAVFNEEKSRKWFVNAVIMWKIQGWEFDGFKFTRDKEVKYKHEILK